MIVHPSLSVLFIVRPDDQSLQPLLSYLQSFPHLKTTVEARMMRDLSPYDVVVTATTGDLAGKCEPLTQFVRAGGGWLGLTGLPTRPLPEVFGAQPGRLGLEAELRVAFKDNTHPIAARLPDEFYVYGLHQPLELTAPDAETILSIDWCYQRNPVLTTRRVDDGLVACTTLRAFDDPLVQRVFYRLLCQLAGRLDSDRSFNVGILGYSPAVGRAHGMGVEATPGLTLHAVCDLDPERLEQAQQDFAALKTYASAEQLARDPDVNLVIIATPPNTHATLALQTMAAGKHVVCEKPLALRRKETAAMVEMANRQQVHLSCHQNRRWDVDYLAIKDAVGRGLIGDLFYVETFVGGFEHPCGLWHSHEAISGGTAYDWGAHYLDWMVSLIPDSVTAVIGTRQNRVWHDITNADQERVQIRFAGGQEAEFLHSDIAAVRKPKWYLLGTEGAIIGHWREVTTYEIDPTLYFRQHDIPPTEMGPRLILRQRRRSGDIVTQELPMPKRQTYPFYHNLADHLLTGEPIVAPLDQSVLVVAILEVAARSAANGGTVEELDG
jgi:predicted dehydrogenase